MNNLPPRKPQSNGHPRGDGSFQTSVSDEERAAIVADLRAQKNRPSGTCNTVGAVTTGSAGYTSSLEEENSAAIPPQDNACARTALPALPVVTAPTALTVLHGRAKTEEQLVEEAIRHSQPSWSGRYRASLLGFARRLMAIPCFQDARPHELYELVGRWLALAGADKVEGRSPRDVEMDFIVCWDDARQPANAGPFAQAFDRALASQPADLPRPCDVGEIAVLGSLCRELQLLAGDEPFFLGGPTVAEWFGIDPATAWRWLRVMQRVGIISRVKDGHTGKASEWRYLLSMDS